MNKYKIKKIMKVVFYNKQITRLKMKLKTNLK